MGHRSALRYDPPAVNGHAGAARMFARPAAQPLRLLLTSKEAAAALGCSVRSLWDLTYPRGPLKPIRRGGPGGLGRHWYYPVDDLRAWIEAQQREQYPEMANGDQAATARV